MHEVAKCGVGFSGQYQYYGTKSNPPNMSQQTRHLQLPFQFDETKLLADLARMQQSAWIPHFNTGGYEGDWKVIPLYAPGGDAANIMAHAPTAAAMAPTPILGECTYFQAVIGTFKCPILSARILRLSVGAEIKPHRDHALGYEDGCFRLHIPIITNPEVHFVLDGEELTMRPGECWYTNVNFVHSVRNDGQADRMHLVIDGERNAWSDELFFGLAPKDSLISAPPEEHSQETIRRMIEELRRSEAPAAQALIAEWERKLEE